MEIEQRTKLGLGMCLEENQLISLLSLIELAGHYFKRVNIHSFAGSVHCEEFSMTQD